MIVWGGNDFYGNTSNSGGRYLPATDSWTGTTTINAPTNRTGHTAVWTGSEMIIWGGYYLDTIPVARSTGAKYNPLADTWVATSDVNAPLGRYDHTAVWTGNEMILWGGDSYQEGTSFNTGARYDPSADTWTSTDITNAPSARHDHVAVWTGSQMIVWGGYGHDSTTLLHNGSRYNAATDSWTSIPANGPASSAAGVWTGNAMIVWGGDSYGGISNVGGRYDPVANSWVPTSLTNAPTPRLGHSAVWSGSEMIVWGGGSNTGGRYNPVTSTSGNRPARSTRPQPDLVTSRSGPATKWSSGADTISMAVPII